VPILESTSLLKYRDDPESPIRSRYDICVFQDQNRELLRRFGHPVPKTGADVLALAGAIVDFSIDGIGTLRRRDASELTPPPSDPSHATP